MQHIAVITHPPVRSGKTSMPDGAVLGNGDLGIILGNSDDGLRIYISKLDIWEGIENRAEGGLKPLGYVDIPVDTTDYHVEQDMDLGEIRCKFGDFNLTIRVCKTENCILLESNTAIAPVLKVFEGETTGEKGTFAPCGIYRIFEGGEHLFPTSVYAAMAKVDESTFYVSVATNHDTKNPKAFVLEKTSSVTQNDLDALKSAHRKAWEAFWSKSAFTLSDPVLENAWYASQYFLACSAGNPNFAPGLYANFITIEHPSWHSDYHLNYDFQASYYAVCSSNHPELTDGYTAVLEQFLPRGREFAEKFGCGGILYPVGIGPKGICTEMQPENKYCFLRLFLGQKSNGIHPANIMIFRWRATRDLTYAKEHAYPFVKECLRFFEDYMIFEDGRYSVPKDAAHEVPYYKPDFNPKKYHKVIHDKNNVLTLGLLRLTLANAIDMATALHVDEDCREKWAEILEHLSPFPTMIRHFQRVFRYTEKGQAWNDSNDVGLQHIYPSGCIGLSSDEKMLKIARNSFRQKSGHCYEDGNAISSYYPMAARLGIDPREILTHLRTLFRKLMQENMLISEGGGGLEYCSISASTLNEMALQSYDGTLRFFPCWDKELDASFRHLRADGAFLVSSSIQNGKIGTITIESEMGETLRFRNPFGKCTVTKGGQKTTYTDEVIVLPTAPGDCITIEQA